MNKNDFVWAIHTMAESVWNLHTRFGISLGEDLDSIDPYELTALIWGRLSKQIEELGEVARASNKQNFDNLVEEAADNLFVAIGTVLELGEKAKHACYEVAIKNDKKTHETHKYIADSRKIVKKEKLY